MENVGGGADVRLSDPWAAQVEMSSEQLKILDKKLRENI